MVQKLSRRDFIKFGSLFMGTVALTSKGFIPYNVEETALIQLKTRLAYRKYAEPIENLAAKTGINSYTLPDWKPTLSEIRTWLAEPTFFTTDMGFERKIVTSQYRKDEFERKPELRGFRNNCCGLAMLATLTKLFHYLKHGEIPDVTVADMSIALTGKRYIDRTGYETWIEDWDHQMYFDGLKCGIDNYLPLGDLVNTELLTFNWGARYIQIANRWTEWPDLFTRAETACDKGGAIILFCIKHTGGHLVVCTDFKSAKSHGETVVIDSWWPSAFKTVISEWLPAEIIDYDNKRYGKQSPLLGMLALTPKFPILEKDFLRPNIKNFID